METILQKSQEITESKAGQEATEEKMQKNKNAKGLTKTQKRSKFVILLYVISGTLTAYGGYMIYYTIDYVKTYYSTATTSISDELAGVIQYIVTNSIIYFVYALLVFIGARIIKQLLYLSDQH